VEAELAVGGTPEAIARRLVASAIEFHTRWRGLRVSLHQLIFTDAEVRRFYRAQRRRQLDIMAKLRGNIGRKPRRREDDAIHLYMTERTYDALAHGEMRELGLDRDAVIEGLVKLTVEALG
jgi:hypothetical protein